MTTRAPGSRERRVIRLSWAALVVLITVLARVPPAWIFGAEASDIPTYREMATAVLRGDDIYASKVLFPYMPYSQTFPAVFLWLAKTTGLPFHFTVKLPNFVGDGALALALFLTLSRRLDLRRAFLWTLAFALNPVSILVSAFHGSPMELVPILTGLAFVSGFRAEEPERGLCGRRLLVATAALLLGCAIATRSFPLFYVPAFALWLSRTWRGRLVFASLAALPTVFSGVPYLVFCRQSFLKEVLSYSGTPDFGWLACLRAIPLVFHEWKLFDFGHDLLGPSKMVFLAAFGLSLGVLPFIRREALVRATLLPPLLFFGLYAGIAAQYLTWVIPAAVLSRDRWLVPYASVATGAMLPFYIVYHPRILVGDAAPAIPESLGVYVALAVFSAALSITSLAWSAAIVRNDVTGLGSRPLLRRLLLGGALAIALAWSVLVVRGALEVDRVLSSTRSANLAAILRAPCAGPSRFS